MQKNIKFLISTEKVKNNQAANKPNPFAICQNNRKEKFKIAESINQARQCSFANNDLKQSA